MRFRGLPADLHVAEADLVPVTPCVLLLSCANCSYVSPSFYVCMKNHIVCTACSVQGTAALNTIWCPVCRQISLVSTVTIDRDMLAQLRFRCKCGIEKTLPDLRAHILEEGLHDSSTKAVVPMDVTAALLSCQAPDIEQRLRSIAAEEMRKIKHEIDDVRIEEDRHGFMQRLEADKTEILQKTEEDKKEILMMVEKNQSRRGVRPRPVPTLEQLHDNLVTLRDEVDNLKNCRTATASKAHFWFDFDELSKRFQNSHDSVKSDLQHTFIGGIPFQACIKLWSVDKKEYLDICGGRADHPEIDIPLPLNRKVILSIHDTNGKMVATKSCNSLIGNQYLFRFGSKEAGLSRTTKLIELTVLMKTCLINGRLLASIELQPMD